MDLRQKFSIYGVLGKWGGRGGKTGKTGIFMEAKCGGSKHGAQKFGLFSLINELYQITRWELHVTAYMRQKSS